MAMKLVSLKPYTAVELALAVELNAMVPVAAVDAVVVEAVESELMSMLVAIAMQAIQDLHVDYYWRQVEQAIAVAY